MNADQEKLTIVLIYCGVRTGNYGMGSHTRHLIPLLKQQENFSFFILKTDSLTADDVIFTEENGTSVLEIPQPKNKLFLTSEDTHIQRTYASRIAEISFPYLKEKSNLLFWVNTVDHYNLCHILKGLWTCKIVYVHHNFSWKALVKTSYEHFALRWRAKDTDYHPVAFLTTARQKKMADLADRVVTVTNVARDFFIQAMDVPPEKVKTIYNGITEVKISTESQKADLRKKYGILPDEKLVTFCGRLVEEKGISYLIEAFKILIARIPKARLMMIGNGDIARLLKMAGPCWSKIILTGEVGPLTISELYSISDVGVMPSTQEQCSITSIEMRFHRLPMVVSAVEGLDEMFEDEFDALKLAIHYTDQAIIDFSAEEFAEKITRILQDNVLANRLAENSYQKGLNLFNIDRIANCYERLFKSVMLEASVSYET